MRNGRGHFYSPRAQAVISHDYAHPETPDSRRVAIIGEQCTDNQHGSSNEDAINRTIFFAGEAATRLSFLPSVYLSLSLSLPLSLSLSLSLALSVQ